MNVADFRAAWEKFLNRHELNEDEYHNSIVALGKAAAPEHVQENLGVIFVDRVQCSCGWISPGYLVGSSWAVDSWRRHVADAMGLIEKSCPCGKKYLPVDGGKPCHELRRVEIQSR